MLEELNPATGYTCRAEFIRPIPIGLIDPTVFLRFVTAQRGEALTMTNFFELTRGSLIRF